MEAKELNYKNILKNVSFRIYKGERVCFVGKSGSGKSTILRMLNKLIAPSSGEIYFKNENVLKISPKNLRKKVSLIFQEPTLFSNTIKEEFFWLKKLKIYDNLEIKEELINQTIKICDLESLCGKSTKTFSGGEKQKLAIARSIITKPEVLLMDEPTSALDIVSNEKVMGNVFKENPEMTFVIVSHDLEVIKKADRIYAVKDGTLKEYDLINIEKIKDFLDEIYS